MKVKETKGITLIALVITIVVLLILAGVVIATLNGNDNIIKNANTAVGKYNEKVNEEQGVLNTLEEKLKEYTEKRDDQNKENTGITAAEVASDASYIGKYVNYTVPNGGDPNVKWRIFYADSSNIYLIASDYLKYDYVPTKITNGTEYTMDKQSNDYRLSFDNMYQAYTGSADITDVRITRWMKWVGKYPNSTNENIRSAAYMLDSNIWNAKYQNSYAEYVLGGPTIEMFCASYKATHTEKYIEEEVTDANGYKVKWNTDSSYSYNISGLSTSELENLYVISDTTKPYAYRLASPSAAYDDDLLYVRSDGNVGNYYYYDDYNGRHPGLRALVCLKSDAQLVPNGNAYDLSM